MNALRLGDALTRSLAATVAALLIAGCGSDSAAPAVVTMTPASASIEGGMKASATAGPSGVWSTRAPLPEANSELAIAELDGKIYAIGGYPSTRQPVSSVQVYDIAADSWSHTTPLPIPIHHAMAAATNGKIYVIGGESGATANASRFMDTVFEYDPATSSWSARAGMPTARSGGAAAVVDDKIYVAGGRPPHGNDFAVYDPEADAWTTLPDLPTQRNHLAAVAIDGNIYVAGGRFGGGVGSEMTAALEAFDPKTGAWEAKAPLPAPRAGVNGVAARGCFYVFGGEGNDDDPRGVFDDMEVYDPVKDSWTKLTPIPTPVHGVTGSAFVDGWIFLVGGGTSRGGSSGSKLHQVYRAEVSCG